MEDLKRILEEGMDVEFLVEADDIESVFEEMRRQEAAKSLQGPSTVWNSKDKRRPGPMGKPWVPRGYNPNGYNMIQKVPNHLGHPPRRLANPEFVQAVWDAISVNDQEVVVMDLKTLLGRIKKLDSPYCVYSEVQIFQELRLVIADGLVRVEMDQVPKYKMNLLKTHLKTNYDGLELELLDKVEQDLKTPAKIYGRRDGIIYKIPQHVPPVVVEAHDWYCFKCHLARDPVLECIRCPRVYHKACLNPLSRAGATMESFVCPACRYIEEPDPNFTDLTQAEVNKAIGMIIKGKLYPWNRCVLKGDKDCPWSYYAQKRRGIQDWRYKLLVHTPMDLNIMLTKSEEGRYISFKELEMDCEGLVHNLGVYFGARGGYFNLAQKIVERVRQSLMYMEMCRECFSRSCNKKDKFWFAEQCQVEHNLVWTRHPGHDFTYWPAKVLKVERGSYFLRCFGERNEGLVVGQGEIVPMNTFPTDLELKPDEHLAYAVRTAKVYAKRRRIRAEIELLKRKGQVYARAQIYLGITKKQQIRKRVIKILKNSPQYFNLKKRLMALHSEIRNGQTTEVKGKLPVCRNCHRESTIYCCEGISYCCVECKEVDWECYHQFICGKLKKKPE